MPKGLLGAELDVQWLAIDGRHASFSVVASGQLTRAQRPAGPSLTARARIASTVGRNSPGACCEGP